ncbi:hypothetical protein [Pseudomonas synxantha]|uniref:hypothetical protein n=1 Tax=Pseudomonas synxantha TaxID=47883 RepID=UPI000F5612FC|nr:hypothetical protein [Pseudomonas synxantha]
MAGYSIVNGRKVPFTVITSDQSLDGVHKTGFEIVGCTVVINGTIQGSISMTNGATVIINGVNQGSVSVSGGGRVTIFGASQGSFSISRDSAVLIERGGRIAGSVHNDGALIIRGGFGGSYCGAGKRAIEGDGYILQPRIENGVNYYEW